ncbi:MULTISPECIES: FG-GAP repeat domain-containing protein [Actinokineospora]|uniref:Repeat domain-containing protein n=1 Tax=Actinokineospora terrae TaxID=155974 RepID=A0A1H9KIZ6_9PSEU|nr:MULTISPECIES: VCBS repeat-containing protein [Actinokineospora]SEQ98887.1 hypothetical protein SAMN04487818_101196 [Actinokineospora terrae]
MRKLRTAALAALVALALPAALAGVAEAGTTAAGTFRGDVNGDRIADQVTLGPNGTTNSCTVKVAYGRANGTLGAPVESRYTSPLVAAPYCPDMGVVVDLGGDGKPEIVTTGFSWGDASKAFVVLRKNTSANTVRLVTTYPGLAYPSTIRTADFTGEGRVDIWVSSDQSVRLQSFNNTAAGGLELGAIDVCSRRPIPQHVIADFDGDGGQDLLLSRQCGFAYTTAELNFGNGKPPVTFARDDEGILQYEVYANHQNGDEALDVGVITSGDGPTTIRRFHNDGAGAFTEVA